MELYQYHEDIQCIHKVQNSIGSLFISNIQSAQNYNTLKFHNINAVVTAANGAFLSYTKKQLPNYLYIPAQDNENFDISVYFDKTFEFIDKNLKRTNVLVHCIAGVSRSVAVVIAYLMKKYGMTFKEVYEELKIQRNIIAPNIGFVRQLLSYQQKLLNKKQPLRVSNYSPLKYSYIKDLQNPEYIVLSKSRIQTNVKSINRSNQINEEKIESLRKKIFQKKEQKSPYRITSHRCHSCSATKLTKRK